MIFVNSRSNNNNSVRTQWFNFFCVDAACYAPKDCCFLSIFRVFSRVFFSHCFCHIFCLFKWNFVFVHDRDVQLIDWLLIFKYYGISKHTQILCLLNWKTIFLFHLLFVNLRCIYHRGEADCRALPTKWLIVSLDCLFVGQFSLPYKISNVEIAAILSD